LNAFWAATEIGGDISDSAYKLLQVKGKTIVLAVLKKNCPKLKWEAVDIAAKESGLDVQGDTRTWSFEVDPSTSIHNGGTNWNTGHTHS
jgi:hypothetical protein